MLRVPIKSLCFGLLAIMSMALKGAGGTCSLPTEWQNIDWFTHYTTSVNIKRYTSSNTITWDDKGDNIPAASIECTDGAGSTAQYTYLMRYVILPTILICVQETLGDTGTTMLRRYQYSSSSASASVAECNGLFGSETSLQWHLQYPVILDNGTSPLAVGRYYTTYEETAGTVMCIGDPESYTVVTSNRFYLRTCYSGTSSYAKPFNKNLTVVDHISASAIDSSANGNAVLLADESDSSKPRFYCARYAEIDGKFLFSMYVGDDSSTYCYVKKSYTEAGSNYVAFVLSNDTAILTTPAMTTTYMTTAASQTTAGGTTLAQTTSAAPTTQVPLTTVASTSVLPTSAVAATTAPDSTIVPTSTTPQTTLVPTAPATDPKTLPDTTLVPDLEGSPTTLGPVTTAVPTSGTTEVPTTQGPETTVTSTTAAAQTTVAKDSGSTETTPSDLYTTVAKTALTLETKSTATKTSAASQTITAVPTTSAPTVDKSTAGSSSITPKTTANQTAAQSSTGQTTVGQSTTAIVTAIQSSAAQTTAVHTTVTKTTAAQTTAATSTSTKTTAAQTTLAQTTPMKTTAALTTASTKTTAAQTTLAQTTPTKTTTVQTTPTKNTAAQTTATKTTAAQTTATKTTAAQTTLAQSVATKTTAARTAAAQTTVAQSTSTAARTTLATTNVAQTTVVVTTTAPEASQHVRIKAYNNYDQIIGENQDATNSALKDQIATQTGAEKNQIKNVATSPGSIFIDFDVVPSGGSSRSVADIVAEVQRKLQSDALLLTSVTGEIFMLDPTSFTSQRILPGGPCSSSPCQNAGICTATSSVAFRCECLLPFTGPVCNVDGVIPSEGMDSTVLASLLAAFAIIILLIVAMGLYTHMARKKTRKEADRFRMNDCNSNSYESMSGPVIAKTWSISYVKDGPCYFNF